MRLLLSLGAAGLAVGAAVGWINSKGTWLPPLQLPRSDLTPGAAIEAAACRERPRLDRETWRALKFDRLRAYAIPPAASGAYELDHLIPRCLGGVDETSNLWPEPWPDARRKDVDEERICREVCSGRMRIEDGWAYFVSGRWAR